MESTFAPITLFGMSTLELSAALLGVVAVWLTVRQNILCWPIGAVMVALYTYIFYDVKLYADAGLQVVYFILQFYGWYKWLYGGRGQTELAVSRTSIPLGASLAALAATLTAVLGVLLHRYTDASLPFWDAAITGSSLIAQWMMAKKKIECWIAWIIIDVTAVGVFYVKELYPTAVLYGIFCILAALGFAEWKRDLLHLSGNLSATGRPATGASGT